MLKTLFALASCHKIIVLLAIVGLTIWFWRMLKIDAKVIGDEDYSPFVWFSCIVKIILLAVVIIILGILLFIVSLF